MTRLLFATLLMMAALMGAGLAPGSAEACGKPKPQPLPGCSTPVPTKVPTSPPVTQSPAVTPPSVPTSVVVIQTSSSPASGEFCHFEPTTNQWEIRRGDAERAIREGNERPISPGVCDQHIPALIVISPTPTVSTMADTPVIETTPEPTIEPTPQPTAEPTIAPTSEIPEEAPSVPVQIPTGG